MSRIGIVGGTFDPPHFAHLVLGEHGREELNLDKVLFVPAGEPPHKASTRTPSALRVEMIQLAIQDNPYFELSRVDVDRPGPHYTIDMLSILREQYHGAQFFLLMGEDMFNSLPTWDRAEGLFADGQLPVAVMHRLGASAKLRLDRHKDVLPGLDNSVILLKSPLLEISSTEIVQRLREGRSARYLLPDTVLRYIEEHGLYKDAVV